MLSVNASLQLGNSLYDAQSAVVRLKRGLLPVVDRLEVVFPSGVTFDGAAGDEAVLKIDGGEGGSNVFAGRISKITKSMRHLSITANGPALELARCRPSICLETISAGDAINTHCDNLGIKKGEIESGPTMPLYVCDGRSTALQEVVKLAHMMGCDGAFDSDGALHASAKGGTGTETALKYGREIIDLQVSRWEPDPNDREVVGEGTDSGGRVIADFFGGMGQEPGTNVRKKSDPKINTVDDARTASAAWSANQARRETPVRMRTWMLPQIEPGTRIELHEMPEYLDISECRVSQVIHVISPKVGAYSEIWGCEQTGGVDMFAGLLSMVGGLF